MQKKTLIVIHLMGMFTLLLLFLVITGVKSQSNYNKASKVLASNESHYGDVKLPNMWVSKAESKKRVAQFKKGTLLMRSKFQKCKEIFKDEAASFLYSLKNFQYLLVKMEKDNPGYPNLRVYIASFDTLSANEGFHNLPDKRLTLIFAPADKQEHMEDIGRYYFINEAESSVQSISVSTKKKWVAYYLNKKMPGLIKTIKAHGKDGDNYESDESGRKTFSDTKSILYQKNNIIDAFENEITYQRIHNKNEIKYIQVNFASYTKDGINDRKQKNRYKNRLFILFEYLILNGQGIKEILYIDDQPDFPARYKLTFPTANIGDNVITAGVDNGQLCPANCPKLNQ